MAWAISVGKLFNGVLAKMYDLPTVMLVAWRVQVALHPATDGTASTLFLAFGLISLVVDAIDGGCVIGIGARDDDEIDFTP